MEPADAEYEMFFMLAKRIQAAGFSREMAEQEAAAIVGLQLAALLHETLH